MTTYAGFEGFYPKTVKFFEQLTRHNQKAWFDEHRQEYEDRVLTPARDFVSAMGEKLKGISKGLIADPRVNQSLFRINRDLRFSHDKSPYKTHMGIWFWEGPGKRMECSGFYFHLDPPNIMVAAGLYQFPGYLKHPFRQAVLDPKQGKALRRAVNQVSKQGYDIGITQYKRVPRGFDPEHPNADLLKLGGLVAMRESPIPDEFYTPELADYCIEHFKRMKPIHSWMLKLTQQVAEEAK